MDVDRPDRHAASSPRRSSSRASRRTRRGRPGRGRVTRASPASARRRRSTATTRRPSPALAYVEEHADALGDDPFALERDRGAPAAARVRGAGRDRRRAARPAGKLAGLPVWRLLGLRRAGPPTSWTIWLGDPDDMARRAEQAAPAASSRLKLKLGGRDGLDVERVRAVRAVTGRAAPGRRERVLVARRGARRAAAARRARRRSTASSRCRPAIPAGLQLKAASPIPIYVDEDCHTLARRRRLRGARARDQHQAREVRRHPRGVRMAHAARALGLGVHARLHDRVGARHRGRARRSRASATTSTSTATSCSRTIPWPGVELRRRRAAALRPTRPRCQTSGT